MTEEYKTRESVSELVPHKGKMLLLDRVQSYSVETVTITTEIDISRDSFFYEEELGGVPAWVAFEYMAQSISALSGIYGRSKGEKPKVGFIMSVSGFKSDIAAFKEGDKVVVTVHETIRMDSAVTFDGIASIDGKTVVTATLNTVEVDNAKETLGIN